MKNCHPYPWKNTSTWTKMLLFDTHTVYNRHVRYYCFYYWCMQHIFSFQLSIFQFQCDNNEFGMGNFGNFIFSSISFANGNLFSNTVLQTSFCIFKHIYVLSKLSSDQRQCTIKRIQGHLGERQYPIPTKICPNVKENDRL